MLRRDDYFALKAVADTIGRKIGADASQAPDSRAFLTAYYGELRAHLERKLLLGNRKADKHAAVASQNRRGCHDQQCR